MEQRQYTHAEALQVIISGCRVAQESGATSSFDHSHMIQVNSTVSGATSVTNYEYELRKQLAKGRIKLLRNEFLDLITDEFATLIGA